MSLIPSEHCASVIRRGRRPRRAFSLVEMVAATALVAGTLAPALAVMRDAMAASREAYRRSLVANYAATALEYAAAVAMQSWTPGTVTGNLAGEGHAALRYTVTYSDAPAGGGLTGRLMHIQAVVYDDANGNAAQDAAEIAVRMRTKVAKLVTYQNEPN
jgi:hypothetical protein